MPHYQDPETGEVFFLDNLAGAREGLFELTDQQATIALRPALADAKEIKWARAKRKRDAVIDAGVSVAGIGTFDSDAPSRANINGAVMMAFIAQSTAQPFAINWKLADNSVVTINVAQMIGAGVAVGERVAAVHAHAQTLGTAIQSAADHAALEAIDVEVGWP